MRLIDESTINNNNSKRLKLFFICGTNTLVHNTFPWCTMGDQCELLHRKLMNTIMTHYRSERERGRASDGYQWAGRRDSSTSAAVARVTASRQHWQTHTGVVLLQRQGQHAS